MRFIVITISLLAFCFVCAAQVKSKNLPKSFSYELNDVDHIQLYPPSMELIMEEDNQEEKNGTMLKIGRLIPLNANTLNSGTWSTLKDGTSIWQLRISSEGAKASGLYFDTFDIPEGSVVYVYSSDRKIVDGPYTKKDNPEGEAFMIGNIAGSDIIIEYVSPISKSSNGNVMSLKSDPKIQIGEFSYIYKNENNFLRGINADTGFAASQSCEINVNCTEGDNWRIQQRGVARILVREGLSTGYCSGSLINNTRNDGTTYFLTANHCGPNATALNFNQWKFRFNYESATCTTPSSEPTGYTDIIGCTKVAEGAMNGGSDYYLLQLNNLDTEKQIEIGAIFNGWNNSSTATASGVCIHHPSGDIKKISTYTGTPTTMTYNGGSDMTGASNAHWKISWSNTTNGQGVTEGGSSGSPLFDKNGLIIGTLSGGSSQCGGSALYNRDLYGKFSYHWANAANGTTSDKEVKPWLDPNNTGATTCTYYDPAIGSNPNIVEYNFSYNFETCTQYAVDEFYPCTTMDIDGSPTYSIEGMTFTNQGYTGSVIAFPGTENYAPHGGSLCGIFFNSTTPPNNDWFITPAIRLGSSGNFKFYAKSITDTYGKERFNVYISTTNANIASFTKISSGNYVEAPTTWTEYSYNLSAYAGQTVYIAIQCVSNDAFAFLIDDISVNSTTSVEEEFANNINIYPNPSEGIITIDIPESNASVKIINVLGETINSFEMTNSSKTIDLKDLSAGVYYVEIQIDGNKIIKKFILN